MQPVIMTAQPVITVHANTHTHTHSILMSVSGEPGLASSFLYFFFPVFHTFGTDQNFLYPLWHHTTMSSWVILSVICYLPSSLCKNDPANVVFMFHTSKASQSTVHNHYADWFESQQYIGWQWCNFFLPYLWQFCSTMMWGKLCKMFVIVMSLS